MKESIKDNWKKWYVVISMALLVFSALSIFHCLTFRTPIAAYWYLLPLPIYFLFKMINRFIRPKCLIEISLECVVMIAAIFMLVYVRCICVRCFINGNMDWLLFVLSLNFLLSIKLNTDKTKEESIPYENKGREINDLFNIFYLNTSKAHEIAMLIDNKIMKTIEREQTSEELLKHTNAISLKGGTKASANFEYIEEDNAKRRVFESFDVKTTKSIMLRKIYDTVKCKNGSGIGALMILENIELEQLNYDDTAMLMSILQDSKLRNQGNDSIEVNLSKMIDRMLDDFTIDYTFKHGEKNYVIQLPYKAKENFENGYHHNDIQLGNLSIIGIYRGEIDFATKGSVSSRFFELVTSSMGYDRKVRDGLGEMKFSNSNNIEERKNVAFDFNPQRLMDKHHLIDVIAIIQEINIGAEEGAT